jgi:riboflavin synthase
MFTGLIEEIGTVRMVRANERGLTIEIAATAVLADLAIGDSIAVDGVCQTVVEHTLAGFSVEAMGPTLERTTFGSLLPGMRVNLERALALGDRLGGHLVQGHVDAVGTVENVERVDEHVRIDIAVPEVIAEVTVLRGSIAVDGVSLTVNDLPADGVLQVALIPHTWAHTNLSDLAVGDRVNLEGDMFGKFVIEYLKRRGANAI